MQKTHPPFLQVFPALALFLLAQYLGGVRKVEPFHTYLYLFSWIPFIWTLDRILLFRTGRSNFTGPSSPLKRTLGLFGVSTTFWLIFEGANFRMQNWFYTGLPEEMWIRWPGYALSYATVLPGIFFLGELVESYLPERNSEPTLIYPGIIGRTWSVGVGLAMFVLPLIWPLYFFPLVWGSFFFLLEPAVQRMGGHSLLQDWSEGRFGKTISLLSSGFICGLFWEACNFGAGAKWHYSVPFVGFLKIFEMPVLGFLGFPAFALELFVMHQFALKMWDRAALSRKLIARLWAAIFWVLVFIGIDRFTAIR